MKVIKSYNHLTIEDRRQIYRLSGQRISVTEIAARLGRHRSTVFREIQRNRHDAEEEDCQGYFPVTAQDFAGQRRRAARRKLLRHPDLRDYVISKLKEYWSPDQISGYMRQHNVGFYTCPESIYRYVYSPEGKEKNLYRYLFRSIPKRRQRFGRKSRNGHIPEENSIHLRPESINNRADFGHWECDLMIFLREHGQANVTSMIERKSRYMMLAKNENKMSGIVVSGIAGNISKLPGVCCSITFDRGSEFMAYPLLRKTFGVQSYFCDPRAPWQKGSVENNNGRIRRFLPANTNIATVPEAYLYEICLRMNKTPRKCLQYRTPQEVFTQYLHCSEDRLSCNHNLSRFR